MAFVAAAAFGVAACGGKDHGGQSMEDAFRPLEVGVAMPAYTVSTIDGRQVTLGGAGPVTLVNVWATWCTSCRQEMQALDSLGQELGPRGLRVVGVSVDRGGVEQVRRFVEESRLRFTVAHDPAGDIEQQYQVVGVPTTLLIGRDGRLLWRRAGDFRPARAELRAEIVRALEGGTGAGAQPATRASNGEPAA
ncbi:MAG: alkyl hydroperoxide reductase/Thiol specific antioxidant/Mal allergen [Gemmatimonadetes bacterium]|nr:alkyl hydroperoxide reductase/Thiol specific antioxidant/Mal allergen [Gemmatimonadota bacterium]